MSDSLTLYVGEFSLGKMTSNAVALREYVKGKLEGYKAENYSGDRLAEAKKDRAELNASSKTLNDQRIEYEKKWMEPFNEFKSIINETCSLIKTASSAIDRVVKEVEDKERDAKREWISQLFASKGCTLFTLDQISLPSWLNKGYKEKDIEAEIDGWIKKVNGDLEVLDRIGEEEAKVYYLKTLDLNSALAEADRIKKNRELLAERAKPAPEPEPTPPDPEPEEPSLFADLPPATVEYRLRVRGTLKQMIDLRRYMEVNGINYINLDKEQA